MSRWTSALHPRDARGRFKAKGSHSIRVSTQSVSYNAGLRVPIVPGKANAYVGVIARVERADRGPSAIDRAKNRVFDSIAARVPQNKYTAAAGRTVRGGQAEVGGATINLSRPKTRSQLRVSSRKTYGRSDGPVRVSTRRARAPRAPRSSTRSGTSGGRRAITGAKVR